MERLFEMDGQLLLWIREAFAGPVMDKIMIFISSLANKGMLWIGIGMVLLLWRKGTKMEQSRTAGAAFSGIQYGYLQSSAEALGGAHATV